VPKEDKINGALAPAGAGLETDAEHAMNNDQTYSHSSAFPGSTKDEFPRWLKPRKVGPFGGTAEAVPFQKHYDNFQTMR
jgi:hypothetical protein